MERGRRRLFTVAISVAAGLVVLAAAASGVFQLAVQAVPGYRADVEKYVREVTGKAVRIDALGLTWRYYYPSLELLGVALLGDDDKTVVLQAERLRLGFSLARLVRGDVRPNRLELIGLALDVHIDRDGHVAVHGIEEASPQAGEPVDALQPLTTFAQLRVARCRLNLHDDRVGSEVHSFGIEEAELERGLLGSDLSADVALPASVGEAAHLEVSFTGELLTPKQWSGAGTLELSGLAPDFWFGHFLARGVNIAAGSLGLSARGRFDAGALLSLDLRANATGIRARRAGHAASLEALEARVGIEVLKDGWRAELKKLALEGAQGRWPATGGELRATEAPGSPTSYEGRLDYLRLADLAPWLQVLNVPEALASLDGATGELRDLSFRAQGSDDELRYGYRTRFMQLALPAQDRGAGFSGASGELAGDEHGGRAVLSEAPFSLSLPGVLTVPAVPFDALEAEVEWRRGDALWRVAAPQFRWSMLGTRGQGRLELKIPDDAALSPEINLSATFSATDVTRAKPLMPTHWSSGLRSWLDHAILSGDAPHAQLEIHGPLADFPYEEKPTGSWSLDIEATRLNLAYQPDWPGVEDFGATLHFRGNSLAIETRGGTVAGNPIQAASARFPDFRTGQLLVDGSVSGETANFYAFLAHSPLREIFRGLLDSTTGTGPAAVEIHLDIPVVHAEDTQASGRVTLSGVQLQYKGFEEPIRDIKGVVDFAPGRIEGHGLTAQLYELPVTAALAPQEHGTLLNATFPLTLDASGKGASTLVPAWVRRHASGTTRWNAKLPIGTDAASTLTLSTDMTGLEVKAPAPIGKPAAEAVPLTITIGSLPSAPLRITADYQNRLGADLRYARGAELVFDKGTLALGGGPLIEPTQKGLSLGGQVDTLDARAWAEELQGPALESSTQTIRRADLRVGHATWGRWALRDARWQWQLTRDGWTLGMLGVGAIGELQYHGGASASLGGRLDALALDEVTGGAEAAVVDEPVLDPGSAPVFDLDVKKLTVGNADLGHVTFASERVPAGQKLKVLHAEGGSLALDAQGEWRRRAGQSTGNFSAEMSAKDPGTLLKAFGYTQNLDAKKAMSKGALTWAPSARGLDWAEAQGNVHLEFENGQLRSVEPGAGRVLGLLNFYALPRRLSLNFKDVVSSGLGFDKISGDFDLRDGSATTQNLTIDGPSLRMDVRGRIGLAARDYDQQVTVYPDVSAGVTLGALALGGPVAGALTWLAQQVLSKPLDQVTQLSYRVTGSWDNPQVERGAAAPQAKTPDRVPGPPSHK